ncbi:MAG: hypothetical protein WBM01_15130 [Mycobacterium sp.]|uniref:hypothetical protein n=1 Tax=Mycobacterium sp. TaxID=1785 RepID=UPI002F5E9C9E
MWPNDETGVEAALLYARGRTLREVLARFPDEVREWHDQRRRVIYAHYALVQELVGEPDLNPDNRADMDVIKAILRDKGRQEGIVWVRCRTGKHLGWFSNEWPPLSWCEKQIPPLTQRCGASGQRAQRLPFRRQDIPASLRASANQNRPRR